VSTLYLLSENRNDKAAALSECCKNLYGKLAQTASWGLAALQSMTPGDKFDKLPESEQQTLRNLPARVFYGVNTDEAIALRLFGCQEALLNRLHRRWQTNPEGHYLSFEPPCRRQMLAYGPVQWEKAATIISGFGKSLKVGLALEKLSFLK
jgi:hypothetical protein